MPPMSSSSECSVLYAVLVGRVSPPATYCGSCERPPRSSRRSLSRGRRKQSTPSAKDVQSKHVLIETKELERLKETVVWQVKRITELEEECRSKTLECVAAKYTMRPKRKENTAVQTDQMSRSDISVQTEIKRRTVSVQVGDGLPVPVPWTRDSPVPIYCVAMACTQTASQQYKTVGTNTEPVSSVTSLKDHKEVIEYLEMDSTFVKEVEEKLKNFTGEESEIIEQMMKMVFKQSCFIVTLLEKYKTKIAEFTAWKYAQRSHLENLIEGPDEIAAIKTDRLSSSISASVQTAIPSTLVSSATVQMDSTVTAVNSFEKRTVGTQKNCDSNTNSEYVVAQLLKQFGQPIKVDPLGINLKKLLRKIEDRGFKSLTYPELTFLHTKIVDASVMHQQRYGSLLEIAVKYLPSSRKHVPSKDKHDVYHVFAILDNVVEALKNKGPG